MNAMTSDQPTGISVVVSSDGVSKIPATGPAAAALRARSAVELNSQLFVLMDNAGHNPRTIEKLANERRMTGLSKSTVQRYLSGPKRDTLFPNQTMLVNFVTLCGSRQAEIMCFVEAWKNLRDGRLPDLPLQQCTEAAEPPHPVVHLFGTPTPGDRVVREYRLLLTDNRMLRLLTHLFAAPLTIPAILGVVGAGALWGSIFVGKHPKTAYTGAVVAGLLAGPLLVEAAAARKPARKGVKVQPDDLTPQRTGSHETVAARALLLMGETSRPATRTRS